MLTKIDCSDDPYDVTPVTAAILDRVALARSRQADSKKPVVVLMGEVHDQPSHRLLMQGFLEAARSGGLRPAFHMEHEHQLLSRIARIDAGVDLKGWQAEALSKADTDGRVLLQAVMAYRPLGYSPLTGQNLMAYCLENAIPVAFTDAAKSGRSQGADRTLDVSDRQTAAQIASYHSPQFNQAAAPQDLPTLLVEEPDGIAVRNRMMRDLSAARLESAGSDLLVHHCGREHLLGDTRSGFAYKDSLAVQFAAQGYTVISVFPQSSSAFDRVPDDAIAADAADVVLVEGLSALPYPVSPSDETNELLQFSQQSDGLIGLYETSPDAKRQTRGAVRGAIEALVRGIPKPKL